MRLATDRYSNISSPSHKILHRLFILSKRKQIVASLPLSLSPSLSLLKLTQKWVICHLLVTHFKQDSVINFEKQKLVASTMCNPSLVQRLWIALIMNFVKNSSLLCKWKYDCAAGLQIDLVGFYQIRKHVIYAYSKATEFKLVEV